MDSDPQLPFAADVNLLSQVGAAWVPVDALVQTTVLNQSLCSLFYCVGSASRPVSDQPQIESFCIIALNARKSRLDSPPKHGTIAIERPQTRLRMIDDGGRVVFIQGPRFVNGGVFDTC